MRLFYYFFSVVYYTLLNVLVHHQLKVKRQIAWNLIIFTTLLAYVSWGSLASRRIDQNSVKDCIRSLRGNRLFKIPRRRRPRKRRLKSEFAFFQSPSRILQLIYFVKLQGSSFWAEFLRTIFKFRKRKKM